MERQHRTCCLAQAIGMEINFFRVPKRHQPGASASLLQFLAIGQIASIAQTGYNVGFGRQLIV